MTFRRRDFLKALGATLAAANLLPGSLDFYAAKFSRIEAINFTAMNQEERNRSFSHLLNHGLINQMLKESVESRNYFI